MLVVRYRNKYATLNCINKSRKSLEKVFKSCQSHRLTGTELHTLFKGRRIQFNTETADIGQIDFVVQKDIWKTEKRTWQGIANILNEWDVGEQIRKNAPFMKPDEIFSFPLDIPAYITFDEEELTG